MFITKTEVAKMFVSQLIAFKVARTTANAVADRADIDPDGIVLGVTTQVGGELVALAAAPYTDRAVDLAIHKTQAYLNSRKTTVVA